MCVIQYLRKYWYLFLLVVLAALAVVGLYEWVFVTGGVATAQQILSKHYKHKRKAVDTRARVAQSRDAVAAVYIAKEIQKAHVEASTEAAGGWVKKRTRKRPKIEGLIVFLCILFCSTVALANCVPATDPYPGKGWGYWEDNSGQFWCPCLSVTEYDEATSIPKGCEAKIPVVAIDVQSFAAMSGEMEAATVAIRELRLHVARLQAERDTVITTCGSSEAVLQSCEEALGTCAVELAGTNVHWYEAVDEYVAVVLGVVLGGTVVHYW